MSGRRQRLKNSISGQFSARLIEMLESPAYRVLSLAAHRVLSRIEVEWGHHGGHDNGRLPVTFDQFAEYGIDRASIAPAIRESEALGFIQVTERGCAGNADSRRPNLFRLTYKHSEGVLSDGTHEWRRIKTIGEAKSIQQAARKKPCVPRVHRVRKQKPSEGFSSVTGVGNPHRGGSFPGAGNPHYIHSRKTPITSISRVGTPTDTNSQRAEEKPDCSQNDEALKPIDGGFGSGRPSGAGRPNVVWRPRDSSRRYDEATENQNGR